MGIALCKLMDDKNHVEFCNRYLTNDEYVHALMDLSPPID